MTDFDTFQTENIIAQTEVLIKYGLIKLPIMENKIDLKAILAKYTSPDYLGHKDWQKPIIKAMEEVFSLAVDKCKEAATIKKIKEIDKYDYADESNFGVDEKSIEQVKLMII